MGYIATKQLTDHVWLMDDNGDSSGYVIVGKEKALVIDTMNGSEDVKAVAESITSLPLTLINTHVHPDHSGGNHFFEEGYMHPADMPFVEMFTAPEVQTTLTLNYNFYVVKTSSEKGPNV